MLRARSEKDNSCSHLTKNRPSLPFSAPRTIVEPDGTVEGYASLFGAVDQARDMMLRGAFADTLRQRPVRRVPMLFQHDPAEPVGVWLELREDNRGFTRAAGLFRKWRAASELYSLIRAGAIDGLSIGFRTTKGRVDPRTRVRALHAVDLWEISIVTFPLLAGARVHAVKQAASPPRFHRAHARRNRLGEVAGCTRVRRTVAPTRMRGAPRLVPPA